MIEYYTYIATFYLIILTYQDLTNNRIVNDRANWVCLGLAISLLSHFPHKLIYMLMGLPIIFTLRYFLIKYDVVGEADINSLTWIFYGFFIINIASLITFALTFTLFYVVKTLVMIKLKKDYLPLYPEILGSWLITCFCFGLF